MADFRKGFADELRRLIRERNLSVTEAAAALGVSRQAFYGYLNEKAMPRARVQSRAAELWSIEVHVGSHVFQKASFDLPQRPTVVPKQLDFLKQLDAVKEENLHVTFKRVGKTLRVSVDIGIPA